MTHHIETIDDTEFLARFEDQSLDPVHFDHIGHLRLAWLYLDRLDFERALEAICEGIRAYAESLGATGKYHATLTDAYVRIIRQRMDRTSRRGWQAFLEENTDLVEDATSVLHQYFSKARLMSDEARRFRMSPDLQPW